MQRFVTKMEPFSGFCFTFSLWQTRGEPEGSPTNTNTYVHIYICVFMHVCIYTHTTTSSTFHKLCKVIRRGLRFAALCIAFAR